MVPQLETAPVAKEAMLPEPYRIARLHHETSDTFTIDLESSNGQAPFTFLPGQFNMVYVFGIGEVPISISSDPRNTDRFQHTVRVVGAVTRGMCALKRGDVLGIRGPFGIAWPVDVAEGSDVVIVTGGIGLAPLRPALYHVLSHRDKYRKVVLFYGARTPADILYSHELERWRGKFDLDVQVTVDHAGREWRGNVGVVTTLIARVPFDSGKTTALICGPEVMMRFGIKELQERGVPSDRIYLSMERNMKCAIGFCGHCQYGPTFMCKDGPVFRYDRIQPIFGKAEI